MREQNEIRKSLGRKCRRQLRYAQLYLLALIPFLFVLIFSYVPMGGILLAFKDYSITKGIWKSQWAGMKYFEQLFRIPIFPAILKNKYDLDGIDWSALTGESGYREMKFGGRRMLLAWYRSDTRNWLCVEAIPVSDVLAVTKGFRILMLCLLCFGIIVGAALVILTAGRLSAPIIEIGRALGKNDGKIPMEDFVEEVRNLVAYNAELDEKMQLQTSVLKTGAFYRLLTGELLDEKSVEEVLDKIGIPRQASHYVILLVSCNDIGVETRLDEISAQKVFLEKIIREQRYEEIVEIYHIDFERMVILLASRHLSVREIRDRAERLVCEVMELIEKSVFFSVSVGGDIIDNISKLPKAFVHTQKALNIPQNVFGSRKIQWYEQVRQYQAMERYELNSREDSVSLQNLVLMDKAKKYIHENFSDPQLSLSMVGEELCITEVYLSKLFKKVTGENFSKYVENCRMEKAKEWMDQGRKVKEVAELADACRREGLKLGFYYSHVREWNHPLAQSFEKKGRGDLYGNYGNFWDYPNENRKNLQEYIDKFDIPQIRELLTQYGDILTIWFDTPSQIAPWQGEQIKKAVCETQEGCLVNSRLSEEIPTDYMTMADDAIPASGMNIPWETPMTTHNGWGFVEDAEYASAQGIVLKIAEVAAKGGNLLLNVGPDSRGRIPERAKEAFLKVGRWLERNGEAVYGTSASGLPYTPGWGQVTRKRDALYLILTGRAGEKLVLTGLKAP